MSNLSGLQDNTMSKAAAEDWNALRRPATSFSRSASACSSFSAARSPRRALAGAPGGSFTGRIT